MWIGSGMFTVIQSAMQKCSKADPESFILLQFVDKLFPFQKKGLGALLPKSADREITRLYHHPEARAGQTFSTPFH